MSDIGEPLLHEVCEDVVDNAFTQTLDEDEPEVKKEQIKKEQSQDLAGDDGYNEELAKASLVFSSFYPGNSSKSNATSE